MSLSEWQDIASAPRDGTAIQARIPGHGSDNIIAWHSDALVDEDEQPCGAWAFVTEQEPPDCWTEGWCWATNEDGERSAWPTEWKALASVDTHAKRGDSTQIEAPSLMGSAVAVEDGQTP